ncbi:protein lap2- hypothetical protein [Limosa lapponica baueri]|uniref:Leucine-rich repeat-containing protein 7 n=1 Tax=Limosa lapponica baueri TaxID=1758121 RepID=A0A2I0TN16_LIMLA|nr:protein lap2- hypothetical protein [Limosa lapponica baueri]
MVRQAVPLQPVEVYIGADIHLQPVEDTTLEQCLKMTTKRNLFVRLVPCRCLRGEEEMVTTLDYSHCSLEQVPKEIFTFEKTLEELYLDANQIEELPKFPYEIQF